MATHKMFTIKSYFNSEYDSFPADYVKQTMMKVCRFLWVFVCNFVVSSFRHLFEHLAGSRIDEDHEKILNKKSTFDEQEKGFFRSSSDSDCSKFDVVGEEEKSEFIFGFRFQTKEEDLISYEENVTTDAKTGDVFKYQFVSVKDFGGFVAEPESASFTVHELFVEDAFINKEKEISRKLDQVEVKHEEKELNEISNLLLDRKVDDFIKTEVSLSQILERVGFSDTNSIVSDEKYEESVKDQELQEKNPANLGENGGLEMDQVNWLGDFFMRNDSFCYEDDFSHEIEFDSLEHHHMESDDSGDGYFSISPQDVDSTDEPESETLIPSVTEEIDDDYIEFEPNLEKEQQNSNSNSKYESDSCLENQMGFDSGEEYGDDVLLEHQELIDQMKMELRNTRTGGLPTILEECETSRMKDDLKPLKIDEKLEHRDQMAEIQKFYKSYTEKMRKLDILNYQTLQAINCLRMTHPDQLNANESASLSAIKSVLMPSLWPCKLRGIYADPTLKSINELHKDLEIVYVGQMCLSWEILHWQYKKAKELQLYDPQGHRSYNQVAIEFQQFHVLLRRFTEDELFQGPRVLNYTKERCTLRGFLQVPTIKDDSLKEKKARKEDEGDTVLISTMAKTIKEAMAVFWEFLRTDKDTTNLFLTVILQGSRANLQDPNDSDLFMDIKTIYQKKKKRFKDMLRSGNCIVRKFQKHQETILDQHMFVSQVELKLVSRVLSLPRLTRDQLVWCQSKLSNIKFIDRKICVEDSLFLLFPY